MIDFAGAILELYAFDAYGNAIGFDPSVALTEFLYSGEQFDSKIGQQYLRARYYNPVTGRFNRLDPFFGNLNDPQSFHKYLYTHVDPINGIDPSGEMAITLALTITFYSIIAAYAIPTIFGIVNAGYGYFSGQMTDVQAWQTLAKWHSVGTAIATSMLTLPFFLMSSGAFLITSGAVIAGGVGFGIWGAGGSNALLSGIYQILFDRPGIAPGLSGKIKKAANNHDVPAELVATVLVAELLDYNILDYLFDDLVLSGPEQHSMGIAQFRIDNMRKWHIRNWNDNTPAHEIRTALMDANQSVDILAEVLRGGAVI